MVDDLLCVQTEAIAPGGFGKTHGSGVPKEEEEEATGANKWSAPYESDLCAEKVLQRIAPSGMRHRPYRHVYCFQRKRTVQAPASSFCQHILMVD